MSANYVSLLTQHEGSVFAHPVILLLGVMAVLKTLGIIEIDFSKNRRDE